MDPSKVMPYIELPDTLSIPWFQSRTKLSQLSFEDAYISANGGFLMEVDFSGNADVSLDRNMELPPLIGFPESVKEDALALFEHAVECEKQGDFDETLGARVSYDNRWYRVQKMPASDGVWYNFRWVRPPPLFSDILGISPTLKKTLRYLASNGRGSLENSPVRNGLLLVSGVTGVGKTTFMASFTEDCLTAVGGVGVTLDRPVEVPLRCVYGRNNGGRLFQHDVAAFSSLSIASQAAMRMHPWLISIGEIRSREEAIMAIEASINGHFVIAGIHSGSCVDALNKLAYLTGDPKSAFFNMATGMTGVTNQKMLRGVMHKQIEMKSLFFDNALGPRDMLRQGKTHLLSTPIEQQSEAMKRGEIPVYKKIESNAG